MTSANVSKMTADMPFQTNAAAKTGKEEKEAVEFMEVLGSLALSGQANQYRSQSQNVETAVRETGEISKEYDKYSVKENRIPEAADRMDNGQMEEAKGAVEEFADEVSQKMEELFGVSEGELKEAMAELGLGFADLMNPTNLAELMTKLTGQEDSLALLMNPDFQELMQDLEGLSTQLLQKLGMTAEEAANLMNQLQQEIGTEENVQNIVSDLQNPVEIQGDATDTTQKVQVMPEEAVLVRKDESDIRNLPQAEEGNGDESQMVQRTVEENINNRQNQNPGQGTMEDGNTRGENLRETKDFRNEGNLMEEHGMQNIQAAKIGDMPVVNSTAQINTGVNVADIIRQVSEFTRIMYQGNVTSMEMQLNPENLGKIFVQVTAKEGAITAHLAAQNEVVKEVLESQIAILKENMNQQGLKVEAVEVTIASHEFERNLEENQHNQSQEEQQEQASKNANTRRSISLNRLDELSGLMSEEEMLAAKIMRDNGNSVDFTA